jgi:hypothetical protein
LIFYQDLKLPPKAFSSLSATKHANLDFWLPFYQEKSKCLAGIEAKRKCYRRFEKRKNKDLSVAVEMRD